MRLVTKAIVNFGGNQRWRARRYRPRDEREVLDILARHRAERVRAIGSLHSWSDIAAGADIVIDMSGFAEVEPRAADGVVRVGAGCTLQNLLDRLHAATDHTLPALGVITSQTIAGAISTATHGSGRPTVSHFVTAVRLAAHDAAGEPKIFEYRGGDELRAARCGLGSLGVILAVEMRIVPKYCIRDTVRIFDRLDDALALFERYPLSQFALVPYAWRIIAWERNALPDGEAGGGGFRARLFRVLNFVGVDVMCHVLVKASLAMGEAAVRALLKALPGLLIANVPRIDDAQHVLTMRHDLFRHEEMEIFVPGGRVGEAAEVLRGAIEIFAGGVGAMSADLEGRLLAARCYDELVRSRGSYVHHYPLFFRRVLPDDTLVSMTASSDEPWFSISLFTYCSPQDRGAYYALCSWCARALHSLLGARLHWGKHFPLGAAEVARMYPHLAQFRQLCRVNDPAGVFCNEFAHRVLQLRDQ